MNRNEDLVRLRLSRRYTCCKKEWQLTWQHLDNNKRNNQEFCEDIESILKAMLEIVCFFSLK